MFRIKHSCNGRLCLRGRDEERWQDTGCWCSARSQTGHPVLPLCPGRENPWICKQQCKALGEAGQENSQWCFLAPLALNICLPTSSEAFLCVCPLSRLFYFYMPDDSCIFGPLAFEEARKHYDFPMLKKRKENTFPPRCFILI